MGGSDRLLCRPSLNWTGLRQHLETALSSLETLYSDLKKKIDELACNESSDTNMAAKVDSLAADVKGLVEVTDIHQLKLDAFNEEFFAYSKIVDDLQGRVFNVKKNLA